MSHACSVISVQMLQRMIEVGFLSDHWRPTTAMNMDVVTGK